MKFLPESVGRALSEKVLQSRKHSPTILFGVGLTSMVGSTVLACRATLKVEKVLLDIEFEKEKIESAKELVESGSVPENVTYSDEEVRHDLRIVLVQGGVKLVKLYAPAVILGGVGIICLTKSHRILEQRNAALTAAYVAVDRAFAKYRERVVDRFGEDTDRELRYDFEEIDIIDDETGKVVSTVRAPEGDPGQYARWFSSESSSNFTEDPLYHEYNWIFLRNQQNWVNDMLRSRGYVFLNEVYGCLGLAHTSAGQIVGWIYERDNPNGDNYIDFGCWSQKDSEEPLMFHNGVEGAILLDFNVDGPVWELIDQKNAHRS